MQPCYTCCIYSEHTYSAIKSLLDLEAENPSDFLVNLHNAKSSFHSTNTYIRLDGLDRTLLAVLSKLNLPIEGLKEATRFHVAENLSLLGNFELGEKLYLDIISEVTKQNSLSESELAHVIGRLGSKYNLYRRYNDAEDCFRKAVGLCEAGKEVDKTQLALYLNNLGLSLLSQNKNHEAENYLIKAHNIRSSMLGESHIDTVATYINLLTFKDRNVDSDSAYEQLQKIYSGMKKGKQTLFPEFVNVCDFLIIACIKRAQLEKCINYLDSAVASSTAQGVIQAERATQFLHLKKLFSILVNSKKVDEAQFRRCCNALVFLYGKNGISLQEIENLIE